MSIILYRKKKDEWEEGMFEVEQMHHLLKSGWVSCKIESETAENDIPLLEDLPLEKIRVLAKEAGIENWDDAWKKTLVKKLRDLENGNTEG